MAFNYDKHKNHSSGDSFWTSYSDLFLGLSTIFLLLYVTASLRTNTDAIKAEIKNRTLSMRVRDLETQLKMYDNIKKDYLENSAPASEAKEYRELMDKLTLLQEDAKDEKERLMQQATENDAKAQALNKYQQMIRNVINANKLAKTKLNNREDIIDEQHEEIGTQNSKLAQLKKEMQQKQNQIAEGEQQIKAAQQAIDKKMAELKHARKQNKISEKIYAKRLAAAKEEGQEKLDQLRDANEHAQKTLAATKGQLNALNGELSNARGALAAKAGEAEGLRGSLGKAKAEAEGLRGELGKAKAEIDARRGIAKQIKAAFGAKGIKADIDMETGDVILDFGEHYFETGSAQLKPEMVHVLEKAIPTYSQSLLGNDKMAGQISAVEIIGFASPTYKGKYVDPKSAKAADKQALKYNMDLSYSRAKSIFAYVLDENKIKFDHQRDLVPLLKVSGRSFLEVYKDSRTIASGQDFCKVHDCKKAQRVIIRFNMERKK